jgi:hypothetical protein
MKLADGRVKKERLSLYKDTFQYQVESKWETKEWVDQHGVEEVKKTPSQSIQERVHHIKTDTQETLISSMYDTITKLDLNVWMTHLRTLLDSNGHIHSGQVKEDVFETLHLHYFEYKKNLRPNKYGQTERDSEKEGAPDCDRQVPPARVLRVCPARTVRHRRTEQRLPAPRHGHHAKGARR